jgi:hypothetical protein
VIRTSFFLLAALSGVLLTCNPGQKKIDRYALVSRNNPVLEHPDTLGSLSVGNGTFAFTVDASGLQTFVKEYENGIPLGTQAEWGWHTTPGSEEYSLQDVSDPFESCDGTSALYPVQQKEGRRGEATNYLRANPHRLHLGTIGLVVTKKNGEQIKLSDLESLRQELDLWRGTIETYYEIEGVPVQVTLLAHQGSDGVAARIESQLIRHGRLKVKMSFPYGRECHVCPGYDWDSEGRHFTKLSSQAPNVAHISRMLDSEAYTVITSWDKGSMEQVSKHDIHFQPDTTATSFTISAAFGSNNTKGRQFGQAVAENDSTWRAFWATGGAIDFSECTDPRAKELERRVVLSQYLTRIQCAGNMPPQETGLTMNSWFGKFHLEMYLWHAAHFIQWDRSQFVHRSMEWFKQVAEKARTTAQGQGYEGLRWQKMTDPDGNESPSSVGAFIIWQQPHPIYLAELLYAQSPTETVLNKYKDIVFGTADFMASFVRIKDGKYHLCHPLIPAQEIFRATETDDPAYELQYWHYGLQVAQKWRQRLKMPLDSKWQDIIANLAPLPQSADLYLPNATTPGAYINDEFRRDHPSVLAALGFLPKNERLDTAVMHRTLDNIMNKWNWESTWGWDYPMIAMTATRLYEPEKAIDALLMDVQKNTYLVNGHNYQDKRLRLYLPGNGGLLAAVAFMAAGWEGSGPAPGFPKDGRWNVRWENLIAVP